GWDGSDYVGHAAQTTNSSSPPPPRTSGNWPRSFPHRSKCAKPDRKGARARFGSAISALANLSVSTEWADSGLSLQLRPCPTGLLKADIQVGFSQGLSFKILDAVSSQGSGMLPLLTTC